MFVKIYINKKRQINSITIKEENPNILNKSEWRNIPPIGNGIIFKLIISGSNVWLKFKSDKYLMNGK